MNENEQENQLIYSFPRNEDEEYQINLRKFKGRHYVDLRLWFKAKESQELIPKKKGISFEAEAVPEILKGLNQVMSAWNPKSFPLASSSKPVQAVSNRFRGANARQ